MRQAPGRLKRRLWPAGDGGSPGKRWLWGPGQQHLVKVGAPTLTCEALRCRGCL